MQLRSCCPSLPLALAGSTRRYSVCALLSQLRACRATERLLWSLDHRGHRSSSALRAMAVRSDTWRSCSVAVIGAGAAGLAAVRELRAEGHRPVVFEQSGVVGGVWSYDPAIDEDPLGLDPQRERVHSSMYAHLRTNLPREVMSYLDFPFTPDFLAALSSSTQQYTSDDRRYPGHAEVNSYLNAFADYYGLRDDVRLHTRVISARPAVQQSGQGSGRRQQRQLPAAAQGRLGHDGTSHCALPTTVLQAAPSGRSMLPTIRLAVPPTNGADDGSASAAGEDSASSSGDAAPHASSGQAPGVCNDSSGPTQEGAGVTAANGSAKATASLGEGLNQPLEGDGGPATLESSPGWHLVTETVRPSPSGRLPVGGGGRRQEWHFDTVLVCTGHYAEPRLPEELVLAGQRDGFPGFQMHAHSYRSNKQFAGQVVLVVGASNSGDDIAREVGQVAQAVYLSARSWKHPAAVPGTPPFGERRNIHRCHMAAKLNPDSSVVLTDGQRISRVDSVVYCTGYHYDFPFLEGTGIVSTSGDHVYPLWRHLVPPAFGPSLSFLGLRWKIVPFPQVQLQARLVARLLSGRVQLPDRDAMMKEINSVYRCLDELRVPFRYAHVCEGDDQWQYNDWLAEACGPDVEKLAPWRAEMYKVAAAMRREHADRYRDTWIDPEGVLQQAQKACMQQAADLLSARPARNVNVQQAQKA